MEEVQGSSSCSFTTQIVICQKLQNFWASGLLLFMTVFNHVISYVFTDLSIAPLIT